ncbi:hypothetical protein C8J56DRAFT_177374 [Mycena floridula]|nr:hypothetical protein C8J56DRAFT_177374 [Mycena floridula]
MASTAHFPPDPEYNALARRIQRFSIAIYFTRLQPPILHCRMPKNRSRRRWMQSYIDIATLLARNRKESENIVVTSGPSGSISVIYFDPVADCNTHHQEDPPSIHPQLEIYRVLPTEHDVLANETQTSSSLSRHANDVLKALIQFTETEENRSRMCNFFTRRCWSQIKARIDASNYLLKISGSDTLAIVLAGWECHPEDPLTYIGTLQTVLDPRVKRLLEEQEIYPESDNLFRLSTNTATLWFRGLSLTVSRILQEAQNIETKGSSSYESFAPMVEQILTLRSLVECPAIKKIFSFESLEQHLMDFARQPYGKGNTEGLANFAHDPDFLVCLLGDERLPDETLSAQIFRYLKSLISWLQASLDLASWIRRFTPDIRILYVLMPPPSTDPEPPPRVELDSLDDLLLNYPLSEMEAQILKTAVDDLFRSGLVEYSTDNHYHCDAFAMGLISATESDPSSPLYAMLSHSDKQFGSAHDCCYCCNLLWETLFESTKSRTVRQISTITAFSLPGLLLPWTPPPGLPLEALKTIEGELRLTLERILHEYLQPLIARICQPSVYGTIDTTRITL